MPPPPAPPPAPPAPPPPPPPLPFPSFRTWHPILDHFLARIVFALVVELALFALFYDSENKPALVPFLVVTLVCVGFGAYWLKELYRWHVSVWKRLTVTDLLLPIFVFIMLGLLWGMVGAGFGLFHLFWHDNGMVSFLAGLGVAIFWVTVVYLASLLYVNDLFARRRRPPLNEADGGWTRWCRRRFSDFAALFGYAPSPDLALPPEQEGERRKDAINASIATGEVETRRGDLVLGLIVPLVALSLVPVLYSTSTKQDRAEWDSYWHGFHRMGQTLYDRGWFAAGLLLTVAGVVYANSVMSAPPPPLRAAVRPHASGLRRCWNAVVALVIGMWYGLVRLGRWFYEPRRGSLAQRMPAIRGFVFWAGLICLAIVVVLAAIHLAVNPKHSLFVWAAFFFYLSIACWLIYRGTRPPGLARSVHVSELEWRQRLRARKLFVVWGLIFVVGHFLNHLSDVFNHVFDLRWEGLLTPAAVSIALLLSALAVGYGWLRFYRRGAATVTLIALVIFFGVTSGFQNYPHRLEGLEEYYRMESVTNLDHYCPEVHKPSLYHYHVLRSRPIDDNDGKHFKPLDNRKVLAEWDAFVRRAAGKYSWKDDLAVQALGGGFYGAVPAKLSELHPKPPLIILTTSGGASNSGIFTLNMLLELERIHPGISRHVRVVCGASGGMFGAAYFRAQLPELREQQRTKDVDAAFDTLRWNISQDFLGSIAQQWAFKDLTMGFCPFPYKYDRGMALEGSWKRQLGPRMTMTFDELKKQEMGGEYPSLIFSPVLVEDGRQLLISTLDLNDMVEPEWSKDPDDLVQKVRAVEFFKLFPKAKEFKLTTATRLNCGFPFVAPGASLPTSPPRRVVDAGYYDNYGMNVALSWAYQYQDWLRENTSEVIILQLRPWFWVFREDIPDDGFDTRSGDPRFDRPTTDAERLIISERKRVNWFWSKSWLSFDEFATPLQGGYASLRSSMIFRNTQQLRLLQRVLQEDKARSFAGATSLTFVGNMESSMNWYLPRHRVLEIEATVRKAADDSWRPKKIASDEFEDEWYLKQPHFESGKLWNRAQFEALKESPSVQAYFPKAKPTN